jgi:hypothetical protein
MKNIFAKLNTYSGLAMVIRKAGRQINADYDH